MGQVLTKDGRKGMVIRSLQRAGPLVLQVGSRDQHQRHLGTPPQTHDTISSRGKGQHSVPQKALQVIPVRVRV